MSIPTLTDAKNVLNIGTGNYDELVSLYLKSALKLVESRVGPSSVQTFTESVTTKSTGLLLSTRPVVSITSITPNLNVWPSYTAADVAFDSRSGVIWRKDMGTLAGSYDVVYTAGWTVFPDNYHLATLLTVQHLWRTQRGGSQRPSVGAGDELSVTFGAGVSRTLNAQSITLPAAALELIGDSIYYGGIA
jgi:hypothetical protein